MSSVSSMSQDISQTLSYPTDYDDGKTNFPYKSIIEEEGDNDGECRSVQSNSEKSSDLMATSTIVKAIIGFGILNLPYIFKTLGIVPSIIIMGLIYSIEVTSVTCLLRCKDITKK